MTDQKFIALASIVLLFVGSAYGQTPPGEKPVLEPPRVTQAMITSGQLSLQQIRAHGLRMFAAPFNRLDGFGDGPMDPSDPVAPGGRPSLQNNGTFLRVNGLDAQTCMECHSVLSNQTVPFTFGVGGVGGANNNAMAGTSAIDPADTAGNGFAAFNGRFINPPFLFGAGGIQALGKEMTAELQALKEQAKDNPGTVVPLITKGVDFGTISWQGGSFDTSGVEGIDHDLVVRPFGRKGEFITTRNFDQEAMSFHFGMQPNEIVGEDNDDDNDGVANEVLVGEMSALAVFATTLETPRRRGITPGSIAGRFIFQTIGCTDCHIPSLTTDSPILSYSFPEVPTDPSANVYLSVNLRHFPMRFPPAATGGVRVPMFSDLKRHDMGPGLAESNGGELESQFITARLWGVADTAPYLHDGRATTLTDAILAHGGEAQAARDNFDGLSNNQKRRVLKFLRTLRTPRRAAQGLSLEDL